MNNQILEAVKHNPYLGVELQANLKWDHHVGNVTAKANRVLGFIRRNLSMCPQEIKATAYYTLVRCHLEYAAAAWDPHLVKDIQTLEAVQRRAARFVSNNRSRIPGSMTKILDDLNWSSLEKRRITQRLTVLHKAYKKEIAIPIPEYIKIQERSTRHSSCSIVGEALNYIQPYAKRDFYKFSFLPRTIREWNSLPPDVKGHQKIDPFRQAVRQYIE